MRPPVIIGAGPAGTTAALILRQAGQPVILLERLLEPGNRLCADFLGASAVNMAATFGISLAALGARPVTHLRLIRRARSVESRLPFPAMALPRRVFDAALQRAAEIAGAQLLLGHPTPPPSEDGGDFVIETQALGTLVTGTVFLATGRPRGPLPPPVRPGPSAYKMYFRPTRAAIADLAGFVELALIQDGQAVMQIVDRETLMLCLLSRRHDADQPWEAVLSHAMAVCPALARRLEGARPTLAEPLIARNIPLGFMHRVRGGDHDGLYRIGDQGAFVTSLVADGVSVAMRGAARAARTLLSGAGAGAYHHRLRAMLWPRVRMQADYVAGAETGASDNTDQKIEVRWNRLST